MQEREEGGPARTSRFADLIEKATFSRDHSDQVAKQKAFREI